LQFGGIDRAPCARRPDCYGRTGAIDEILIIGAGIGGLAAATALQQHGFDAQVFEAAPMLEATGAGILVPPNGMSVLDRLGLADAVLASGVALDRMELQDLHAGLLQAVDGAATAARLGFPIVAVRRSDLQRILVSALRAGSLQLSKRLVRFDSDGHTVRAHFTDRSEALGRLLIGADGIRSTVRQQLFPGASLRYSGQTCFRGLGALQLPAELRQGAREIWGGAMRFGFARVDAETVYWFAPFISPAEARTPPAELKHRLMEKYVSFPDAVTAAIEATPPETILQTDLHDLAPIQHWTEGNLGLLGDAAHAATPNLGQGGAQALEDALCLASRIHRLGMSSQALRAYERARMRRTRRIARVSWNLGRIAHWENPALQALRNAALRSIPAKVKQRQTSALFTAQV
jgi:2-polyprenyl-6-methoxyphenol hydroxylase-like FAD-dependent oxidoreductase